MSRKVDEQILIVIEETQAELRESIEKTKALAADSDRLLRRARPLKAKPPNPAA